ncbi:hypothetical protein E6W39_23220 [Kitasatospora acidiphila]|uniref:Uncharacterized protein n=1 Tax=Kitasatospora acidiphila TaxID=2567942 RepID=A0A540W8A6_9ACTN|nr:hypothetical protein [Kitasatospora acidiphila]TQF04604.1 hypothetical protein E6W39_23220 [Kitasatospora acidiphila]
MREPVNRTILLLDIERFSRRDDVVQAVLRRSLNAVVDQTMRSAGVEATQQYREDRGDGLIVLLDGDVAKTAVLRSLLTTTPELLYEHNRLASAGAQLRLRLVLASGEVAYDPQDGTVGGVVGHDLNQACRLLDSAALRDALAARADEPCVLMVSGTVYDGVVRHGHRGVRPELFRHTEVVVKDGVLEAWLHGGSGPAQDTGGPQQASAVPAAPQRPAAPAERAPEQPTGPVIHFHGAPVVHGSVVVGNQHGVSGGQVTGNVVLGGSTGSAS